MNELLVRALTGAELVLAGAELVLAVVKLINRRVKLISKLSHHVWPIESCARGNIPGFGVVKLTSSSAGKSARRSEIWEFRAPYEGTGTHQGKNL